MWRSTIGFTPFELLYGKSTSMLVEFEHKTLKIALKLEVDLSKAQENQLLQLNALDEY